MQKRILFFAAFCVVFILILLTFPMGSYGQSDCSSFQCPSGKSCAREDCGPCHSGNFAVTCVCGGSGCSTHNGTCSSSTDCSSCCQPSGGQNHCVFVGCTGQNCPPDFSPQVARVLIPASEGQLLNVSLSRSSPCIGLPHQVDRPSCENCTAHAIDLGPKTNGQVATLLVPRDVPLDFSAVKMDFRDSGIQGGSYVVRNNSGAGLVTPVTSWSFEGNNPASGGPHATDVIDSWVADAAFLAPGSEAPEEIRFLVHPHSGEAIRRVTGTVIYAEFDDGTRLGPGVGTMGLKLRSRRINTLAAYKELLSKIQSGSDYKAIATYLQTTPALSWLNTVHGGEGLNGLVVEITKPRHLAP